MFKMQCEIKAHAKINLCLDVTGRLDNGYHLVKMIMQTVGIHDVLSFERTDGEILITTDSGELPVNQDNLIFRAVRLMQERYGISGGVRVHLKKKIPIAAGMAGGSADAAAALKAMNVLYDLKLDLRKLQEEGVKIGADVPYCLLGGTALSEGIGEILTPLPSPPGALLLVAKPGISVSTGAVYEELDNCEIAVHPDVDGMVSAIREGSLCGITDHLGNVLETVTVKRYPVISRIKEQMSVCGALGSLMSGSGPTVFGIFESRDKAEAAMECIREQSLAQQVFLTGFVNGADGDCSS